MNASTHFSHFLPLSLSFIANHSIIAGISLWSDQISCPNYVTSQTHAEPQLRWPWAQLGVSALMLGKRCCEESHLQPSQTQYHLHPLFHAICIMPRSHIMQHI